MSRQQQAALPVHVAWLLLLQLAGLPRLFASMPLEVDVPPDAAAALDTGTFQPRSSSHRSLGYVIMLRHDPVISYLGGGAAGMAATAQAATPGSKLDIASAAVAAYASFIEAASVSVAARAGLAAGSITYRYRYTAAGFAVSDRLSRRQLDALQLDPEVLSVSENTVLSVATLTTPKFLGLAGSGNNGRGGVWDQLGGQFGGSAGAGEGVVIGVLDTGIWPEHPSFSDRQNLTSNNTGPYAYTVLDKQLYKGECVEGEGFQASSCNRKLVGCQYFAKSFGEGAVKQMYPEEIESCRDIASHGSHTAATAAGNYGVRFRKSMLSGMAPRARIAAYKVCWGMNSSACPVADMIAALDKAVADGVDIINISIGGKVYDFPDALGFALMQVARAGVFVAAAAGNDGPAPGSVENAAPWVTTVAASSHNRAFRATVVLSKGSPSSALKLAGAGYYNGVLAAAPLLLAEQGAKAQANMARVQQCYRGMLDPAKVAGKVVVCDRGGNSRTEKAEEVKEAGGIGMLLLNTPNEADWVAAQHYVVPTVHLLAALRDQVRAFIEQAGAAATARFLPLIQENNATAPLVAAFSSQGPEPVSGGILLKPDITAPGLEVVAAASPRDAAAILDAGGSAFALFSGTSMSSPHVAGLAALIRQKHPTWSPMAIKSALMTTAFRSTQTGTSGQQVGNSPFAFGAGHVNPEKMLNPGLVFDSSFEEWSRFVCAARKPSNIDLPDSVSAVCGSCATDADACTQPADFNLPSISLPSLVAGSTKIVTRRVTNSLNSTTTFSTAPPPGSSGPLRVDSVTPASFTLAPGQSQEVKVAVRIVETALGGGWAFLSAAWSSDKGTYTRIPIAAKASVFEAPKQVKPLKDAPRFSYQVMPGWHGTLDILSLGISAPTIIKGSMLSSNKKGNMHNITVPAGTGVLRVSMFAADLLPAACCDLDLQLTQGLRVIGTSWSPRSADEQLSVRSPEAGTYTIYVMGGYDTLPRKVTYYVYVWMLGSSEAPPAPQGDGSSGGGSGDGETSGSDDGFVSSGRKLQGDELVPAMAVAPLGRTAVSPGTPLDVQLSFNGLQFGGEPPKRYFGMIDYVRGKDKLSSTRIDILS